MATSFRTLGFQNGHARRRLWRLDGAVIRWVIGLGGVVALLALAALPAPEVEGVREAPAVATDPAASPVMEGRGTWTGSSSMAHEWRQAPAVTPGGWSAPVEIAH
jgi:hypothetical protein